MEQQRLAITIVTARVLMSRAGSVGLTDCGVLDPIWPLPALPQMVRTTRYQMACARMWEIPAYYALKRERR